MTSLPIVNEQRVCDCDAKLADLARAVELGNGVTEDLRRLTVSTNDDVNRLVEVVHTLVAAVNVLGQQSQAHTDQTTAIVNQIGQFGQSIAAMGPAGMLKSIMGKKG